MKFTVALAAVAALAFASPPGRRGAKDTQGDDERFLEFVAKKNKFPHSTEEFRRRKNNFLQAEGEVERLNKISKAKKDAGMKNAAEFAMNWTADLDREEYLAMLGAKG